MPTQEERPTTLERTVALLQKRSSAEIQDLNRNVTMLLGIDSGQELDIKEIKIMLVTMDERLERLEGTSEAHTGLLNNHTDLLNTHAGTLDEHTGILNTHTTLLNEHTGILNAHTALLNEHTGILNEHTTLLRQILKRLPAKPA